MKVCQIQRRPAKGRFSIEGYFSRVRACLLDSADIELFVVPCLSQGLWKRLQNCWASRCQTADIKHVTGDVNYLAIVLGRRKTILTILDCEVLNRSSGVKRAVLKLFWYTLPGKRSAAITVISEETKRQLLQEVNLPDGIIHVIPVSVSPLFQPTVRTFNSDCPNILQMGTKENKNVVRLAEALNGIECHLDVVGLLTDSAKNALEYNNIKYTNHTQLTDEQVVDRYIQADIISFVSTYEGFGMPIVEAQSVERVCVTSNCSSMPEVAGDGACLVDPFDVASIRNGFERVIKDPVYRNSVIKAGRINKLRFDANKIAQSFVSLYESVYRFSNR